MLVWLTDIVELSDRQSAFIFVYRDVKVAARLMSLIATLGRCVFEDPSRRFKRRGRARLARHRAPAFGGACINALLATLAKPPKTVHLTPHARDHRRGFIKSTGALGLGIILAVIGKTS